MAGLVSGTPALMAICRLMFCPRPADRILPIIVSEISSGLMPALRMASLAAITPNSVAESPAKEPPKLPMAVRTADTITISLMVIYFIIVRRNTISNIGSQSI